MCSTATNFTRKYLDLLQLSLLTDESGFYLAMFNVEKFLRYICFTFAALSAMNKNNCYLHTINSGKSVFTSLILASDIFLMKKI